MFKCLAEFRDQFGEAMIVGSGRTEVDYQIELEKFNGLVLFINAANSLSRWHTGEHKYFVTHHISQYCDVPLPTIFIDCMWWRDDDDYRGMLWATTAPKNQMIQVAGESIDEVADAEFLDRFQLRDKDVVQQRRCLLAAHGSATTAIHLAWFAGCKKITFIGCNPHTQDNSYDPRIASGHMLFQPDKVRENNLVLPGLLGITAEYK